MSQWRQGFSSFLLKNGLLPQVSVGGIAIFLITDFFSFDRGLRDQIGNLFLPIVDSNIQRCITIGIIGIQCSSLFNQ